MICAIHFNTGKVFMLRFMTHANYNIPRFYAAFPEPSQGKRHAKDFNEDGRRTLFGRMKPRAGVVFGSCETAYPPKVSHFALELLIVDNGSIEPATQTLFDQLTREDIRVRILRHPDPFSFSALNNLEPHGVSARRVRNRK